MRKKFLKSYAAKMGASSDPPRKVTPAEAEAEVVAVVLRVARAVARNPRLTFGYHERADIEQEGVFYALTAIEAGSYDVSRPLENFLHVHISNRLKNLKRDTFIRVEAPCVCCDMFGDPPDPCVRWKRWFARNNAKQSLMRPVCFEAELRSATPGVEDEVAVRELRGRIDREIPACLRSDYLRMVAGEPVPKARRLRVRTAVLEILGDDDASSDQD